MERPETLDNAAIVLNGLRQSDMDRYLAVLLSPADRRRPLAALYQFHAELARVREVVREPLPGEVRLQYWRDLLDGAAHGESQQNPLAAELLAAIREYRLPIAPLVAMTEARIFDLYDDPMESVAAFEGYAGETASALIQLASLVLDPAAAAGAASMAGHAGVAQGVAGQLLLLPQTRARGQVYIPAEILAATGLDRDVYLGDSSRAQIIAAVQAFAGLGLDHLQRALDAHSVVPAPLRPAYLPVALVRSILEKASRNGATALDGTLRPTQWRRQLRLTLALWRGRI